MKKTHLLSKEQIKKYYQSKNIDEEELLRRKQIKKLNLIKEDKKEKIRKLKPHLLSTEDLQKFGDPNETNDYILSIQKTKTLQKIDNYSHIVVGARTLFFLINVILMFICFAATEYVSPSQLVDINYISSSEISEACAMQIIFIIIIHVISFGSFALFGGLDYIGKKHEIDHDISMIKECPMLMYSDHELHVLKKLGRKSPVIQQLRSEDTVKNLKEYLKEAKEKRKKTPFFPFVKNITYAKVALSALLLSVLLKLLFNLSEGPFLLLLFLTDFLFRYLFSRFMDMPDLNGLSGYISSKIYYFPAYLYVFMVLYPFNGIIRFFLFINLLMSLFYICNHMRISTKSNLWYLIDILLFTVPKHSFKGLGGKFGGGGASRKF